MASTDERHSDRMSPAGNEADAIEHLVHGLIAIANGPDYCMCGATWPCARQEDRRADQP